MVFRFLDLAAELRNHIYDFAANLEEPIYLGRCVIIGSDAGLAQTCRRIRSEYLPVQRRESRVTCDWCNIHKLNEYLDVFHGWGPNALPGPNKINIALRSVPNWRRGEAGVDILPLLNLRRLLPQTQIQFSARLMGHAYQTPLATQECVALHRLVHHEDPIWLADIRSGRFASIRFLRRSNGQRFVDIVFKADRAPSGISDALWIKIPDYSIPESMTGLGHLCVDVYTFVEGSGQMGY